MDWSNFSFGGASGLEMIVPPGQPDPHWWRQRQVDIKHAKGSNRHVVTNLGLGIEKITGTVFITGESNYNAFMNAGKSTLDGRDALAIVQGKPEVYHQNGTMLAYVNVEFIAV